MRRLPLRRVATKSDGACLPRMGKWKKVMQSKRNGLVPIGEVFGGLDGPVMALRKTSPQAVRPFTQADQINQLVGASESDPDLGFMARLMALCILPRTNPRQPASVQARQRPLHTGHVLQRGNKIALRQPAAPAVGVGDDGSRTDATTRVDLGRFALGVHAQAWHLQHQWQGAHPATQSNEAAFQRSCPVSLQG